MSEIIVEIAGAILSALLKPFENHRFGCIITIVAFAILGILIFAVGLHR